MKIQQRRKRIRRRKTQKDNTKNTRSETETHVRPCTRRTLGRNTENVFREGRREGETWPLHRAAALLPRYCCRCTATLYNGQAVSRYVYHFILFRKVYIFRFYCGHPREKERGERENAVPARPMCCKFFSCLTIPIETPKST